MRRCKDNLLEARRTAQAADADQNTVALRFSATSRPTIQAHPGGRNDISLAVLGVFLAKY